MNLQGISKPNISVITQLPSECTGKIIKLALAALQPNVQDLSKALDKIQIERQLSRKQLVEILGIYINILNFFSNCEEKEFSETLVELGFPNEFVASLPFINSKKELLNKYYSSSLKSFQNISTIKWRIDISLMNSSLGCNLIPNVMLCIKLTNGQLYIIQVNKNAFHNIRFNIALILKNIKSTHVFNKLLK